MSSSSSFWVNIACVVVGVVLGAAAAPIWSPGKSDDAELRIQLAQVERRLADLDARLASRAPVPVAGLDAQQLREIVRSALAERYAAASAAPGGATRTRPEPEPVSSGGLARGDEDRLRSALRGGDPDETLSAVREVVRSLND